MNEYIPKGHHVVTDADGERYEKNAACSDRAFAIIKDILDNHLPRVIEGLKLGYVDENQILVIYDHAVRARILKEIAPAQVEGEGGED